MLPILAAAVVAAAAASGDSSDASRTATARQGAAQAVPARPRLVCRIELPTGSRLGGTKICKTQAQWDEIARRSRDTLDDNLRRGLQVTCPRGASC